MAAARLSFAEVQDRLGAVPPPPVVGAGKRISLDDARARIGATMPAPQGRVTPPSMRESIGRQALLNEAQATAKRFTLGGASPLASLKPDDLPDFLRGRGPGPIAELVRGYQRWGYGLYNELANVARLYSGIGPVPLHEQVAKLEPWFREQAAKVAPTETSSGLGGKIWEGLGSAPGAVAEYILGVRALGPLARIAGAPGAATPAGFAAVDALRVADQDPATIAAEATKGALTGGIFKGADVLAPAAKALTLGAVGGTQAAIEGGDAKDITANAAVMGILGLTGPPGRVQLRDVPRQAVEAYRSRPIQAPGRIEPTLNVPPARPRTPNRPEMPVGESPPISAPQVARTPEKAPQDSKGAETGTPAGGDVVVTPRGRKVAVEYQVVEADKLIPSHTDELSVNPGYPAGLQPRDRTRAASSAQIADMAGNLEPSLLGRSASATDGAPIIGPDGVVESGNARVLALRRAYAGNGSGAQRYRDWLASQGYDVAGMKAPVLVRRRTTDLPPAEREAFAREANERTTLAPSASETATADAKAIKDSQLDLYRGGDLNAAANRPFIRNLVAAVVPVSEQGAMFDRFGSLSQDGLRRIENALFGRAYENPQLLAGLREAMDNETRGIGGAMLDAAPTWAKLRATVRAGQVRPEMDVTPALVEAVNIVRRARKDNLPVGELVRQGDMLSSGASPETMAALRLMFSDDAMKRPVSRQRLGESLAWYSDQARKATAGPSLDLGDKPASPAALLDMARSRGNGDLLGTAAAEMRAPAGKPRRMTLTQVREHLAAIPRNAEAGTNHVGLIADAFDPAVARAKEPLRRETILRDLMKALDAPLYQGRMKGRKVLGFFRPHLQEIRIKKANDIEVTAHEIAHLLDDRIPEIRAQWNPASGANARVREELRGVSYDKRKLYEGFAEFVRLWATQKNQAQAKAPEFYRWFESFLDRSEYGPALRVTQGQMHDWQAQAALDRAKSKIGFGRDINDWLNRPFDRFRQSVTDDFAGIMQMEKTLSGKLEPVGAYETARLTRGKAAITEGALTLGAPKVRPDGSHTFEGKGLKQILDPVSDSLDDALLYFVGRSAHELMQQGREHLFTRAEIEAMLALRTNERETAFREYQVWNNAILDFAEAKGAVDPSFRQRFKRAQYLPFHRVGQPGTVSKVQGDWKGIKALTGGTENLRDILGNMIGNAQMLLDAALTNEVRLKVAELSRKEGGARFMAKIPREERVVKVDKDQIERAVLDALGVDRKSALTAEQQRVVDDIVDGLGWLTPMTLRGQSPNGHTIIAVLEQGRPDYYEVIDPLVLRSLTALKRPVPGWITRVLAVPKRIGQASVTLALDFMAANIIRDTIAASVMSRHGFRPFIESAKGLVSRLKQDDNYREFIANGGGMASYLLDETAFRVHLERFYTKKGIDYRTVMDAPAKLLYGAERIADAFEMATRLGEFKRASGRGEHPRHAAYSAREVSTDFAMRGDYPGINFFYDTAIFLKAGVVSIDRAYRGFVQDPNRASIAFKTAMIALASAGLYALNRDNPLYKQLEDWDRDLHWHFFVPKPDTLKAWYDGTEPPALEDRYWHLRLPKIWEVGAFASIAERQIEGILDGQVIEAQRHTLDVIAKLFSLDPVPQALGPPLETFANWDRFRKAPIETQAQKELQPWARSGSNSSRALRDLAEATRHLPPALQFSPAQAEHLIRGYFNTWATYGLSLLDAALYDDLPDARTDQLPVVRRFFRQEPALNTRYVTELYDAIDAATAARRTMRFLDRTYRPDVAAELENTPDNLAYGQMSNADKQMAAFRKESNMVTRAPDLETVRDLATERARVTRQPGLVGKAQLSRAWDDIGALKRFLLDDILAERNAYAGAVMKDVTARRQGTAP